MVVMGLLFFGMAYANDRWGGMFVSDPKKARRRGWPAAVISAVIGAVLVVGGLSTFF